MNNLKQSNAALAIAAVLLVALTGAATIAALYKLSPRHSEPTAADGASSESDGDSAGMAANGDADQRLEAGNLALEEGQFVQAAEHFSTAMQLYQDNGQVLEAEQARDLATLAEGEADRLANEEQRTEDFPEEFPPIDGPASETP